MESEVRLLLEAALAVACDVVSSNLAMHAALSATLEAEEKLEAAPLAALLAGAAPPDSLRGFVLRGEVPPAVRQRVARLAREQ